MDAIVIVSVDRADLQDLEGSTLHTQFGASNDLPYEQPSVARMYDSGIPTVGNVHEVAHAFTSAARRLRGHRPHRGGLAAGPGLLLAGLGMPRLRSAARCERWWDDTAPPARQDALTSAGYGGLLLMGLRGLEPGRSPQP